MIYGAATYNQCMKRDDELNEDSESDARDSDADEDSRNDDDDDKNGLPSAGNRGERPDNLRQRSDWFQKRTGRR